MRDLVDIEIPYDAGTVSAFDTSLSYPVDPSPSIEIPEPVISYPSNWEAAAVENDPVEYESDLAWQSVPEIQPVESPSLVFSKDENTVAYPVELQPAYTYFQDIPAEIPDIQPIEMPSIVFSNPVDIPSGGVYPILPVDYEVPSAMLAPPSDVCECFAAPCNCDGGGALPVVTPPPIVDPPIVTPAPVLPIDVPVTTPPPIVNVTVQTQTPTIQQAGADNGEPTLIFGYPWYYVAGAAVAGLFLLSSMDGKK